MAAAATIGGAGVALFVWALGVRTRFFERHVLVGYCVTSAGEATLPNAVRVVAMALAALVALVLAPLCARAVLRRGARAFLAASARVALALVLALVACELVLEARERKKAAAVAGPEFVKTRGDDRLTWTFVPDQDYTAPPASGSVRYVINHHGNRVRARGDEPDPDRPTLLILGESVGYGQGLAYDDTLAAILERELDLQIVNLSVNGYGTDQELERLRDALPRFTHPVGVVAVFLPLQIRRNGTTRHPHFVLGEGGALTLTAPVSSLALPNLWRDEPYHDDRALALTAALLRAIDAEARARAIPALFLVTNVTAPCRPSEGLSMPWVTHELFEKPGLPYARVDLDREDTLLYLHTGDGHPNAHGARRLADAVLAWVDARHRR